MILFVDHDPTQRRSSGGWQGGFSSPAISQGVCCRTGGFITLDYLRKACWRRICCEDGTWNTSELDSFWMIFTSLQRVISVKGCKGSEQKKLKVKVGETAEVIILVDHEIYMDRYLDHQQFGRFVLHSKSIA